MSIAPLRVLSIVPPMTQLNTPYPSTAYLTGFLRSRRIDAAQEDLALALVLRLYSPAGLSALRGEIAALPASERSPSVQAFDANFEHYAATIAPVIAFLQGRDPTLAHRINGRAFLPEGRASRRSMSMSPLTSVAIRSPGLSARWGARTAHAIWRRCTSTTLPTCCAMRSTRASSSCAMPKRSRRASPPSIRWPKRWPRRRT